MESIVDANTVLLFGALLVLAGIFSSLIATRFGAPLLLIFLVIGMLAGEDGPLGIRFEDYRLTYIVGSIALAVILFDGGLRTKLSAVKGALAPALTLATIGVVISAGLTGLVACRLFNLELTQGLLMGAIVASTDAAAVFFLMRSGGLELKRRIGGVLEIESGTNDPVAVFLTVILVQLIHARPANLGAAVLEALASQALIGAALGLVGGFAAVASLNRLKLPAGLHPLFALANALFTYALTTALGGSGFLAIYLTGLVLGNRPVRAYPGIASFHEAATWFGQIIMFVMLGLLVTPTRLLAYALPALAIALFLMLVGRPIAVLLCLAPFRFSLREQAFAAWVGLRGAVSIFLAAIPMLSGVAHADVYFNVAFVVVLVSLLVQAWTLRSAAQRLGIALPRATPPVDRVELDLPGQLDYEMVGYPIAPESDVLSGGTVPAWARPLMVVRDQVILEPSAAGALLADDYAYFLVPPDRVHGLDRIFAPAPVAEQREHAYFGEFSFAGEAPIATIGELYGFEVPDEDRGHSLAEVFARRFDARPQLGDRLELGPARLVVRALENDGVSRVGLRLEGEAGAAPREGIGAAGWKRRLAAWIRRL